MSNARSNLLQRALQVDAVVSGATSVMMLLLAAPMSELLGLGENLLRGAGALLLPFALFVGWLSSRSPIPRSLAWAVVVVNVLWSANSIGLLLYGDVAPTTLGYVYVIAQAVVVLLFAELQYVGLRKVRLSAG